MSVQIGEISVLLPQFLSEKKYSKIIVIMDSNTRKYCWPKIKPLLYDAKIFSVKPGEIYKNLDTCTNIWEAMTKAHLDRHSLVLNLGGGVIGDMGGFCASTYKRGVDFVQIPTTLLAQVDASVGGKLGVDFQGYKNHIGVFSQPQSVLIDSAFLETLPDRELRSGFAEVIKHCLIRDKDKWNEIRSKDLSEQDLDGLIRHSLEIKRVIVAEDPTEKGLRKILNFGHTLGHAVETFFLDKRGLLHGEAIAVGMITEAYIAFRKNMISVMELNQIEEFLFSIYGTADLKEEAFEDIIKLTQQDKKNKGSIVFASLLNGVGNCDFDVEINRKDMNEALAYYSGI